MQGKLPAAAPQLRPPIPKFYLRTPTMKKYHFGEPGENTCIWVKQVFSPEQFH